MQLHCFLGDNPRHPSRNCKDHDGGSDCDVNDYLGGTDPATEPANGNDDPQPSVLHELLVHDSDNETLHVCIDCIDTLDDELDLGAGCLSAAS